MRLVGFVIAMIALPSAALADAAAIGIGVQNCSQLSKDFGNDAVKADLAYTNWAFGFLSGVNLAFEVAGKTRRNLTAMSFEDKKAYLRSYCDRNPAKTPMDGVVEMYGKMDVFK